MDPSMLPILVALSVGLIVWTIFQFVSAGSASDRKKLKERLTLSAQDDPIYAQRRLILRQMEAKGISGILARISLFQNLYRKLLQAWPDVSLSRFLAISMGMGVMSLMVFTVILD